MGNGQWYDGDQRTNVFDTPMPFNETDSSASAVTKLGDRRLCAEPCTSFGGTMFPFIILGAFIIAILMVFRNRFCSQTDRKRRATDEKLSPFEVPNNLV